MKRVSDEQKMYDEIAPRFHSYVISPFAAGVDFRLPIDVRRTIRLWHRDMTYRRRVVIDFGCGIGEALALVAGKVGFVAGIDFSAGMLRQSKKRLERLGFEIDRVSGQRSLWMLRRLIEKRQQSMPQQPGIALANGNLLRLTALRESCDLGLAINSVSPPSLAQSYRMFAQIVACVRAGGLLIAVFPSLDTLLHLQALGERAHVHAHLLDRVDPETGVYVEVDGQREKFFTPGEIRGLADRNRLLIERFEKIRYPWALMKRHGWGYYPRAPRVWDWYLVARKSG